MAIFNPLSKLLIMRLITSFLILLLIISCKQQETKKNNLGVVNITITGKKSAQPHFEKGLLLLHSFEYEDAREAFQEAQKEDPKMAMAYWGEAMTYNHSLWQEQDYEAATTVLANLDSHNPEKNTTEIEQDLIEAVHILYQPKTEKPQRDLEYSNFMEGLYKKYPSNQEVAAFYALSLLGSVEEGRNDIVYGKGAKIAKGILKENPNHPGALHYLIHSYDDPDHATLALDAANSYSKVAPDAGHALHMPSHIYVAMGMWDDVISSNIASYQASINRMEEKNLSNDARGYHAFHWLQYGYLQKGNYEEAKKMVLDMKKYATETPSKSARAYLVFLKGTYLTETDNWEDEVADIPVDITDLNISVRSKYHFLEGMKAYKKGNTQKLDSILNIMDQDHKRESFIVAEGSSKLCAGVTRDEANQMDLKEAEIRQNQLMALRAQLNNDPKLAEEHFIKSIEIENSISYSYGPPSIQKPTHELYADWLLSQNRNVEAAKHYSLALKNGPGRLRILKGMENTKQVI
jgi:tetratricopeptide (TPR) repeat protein